MTSQCESVQALFDHVLISGGLSGGQGKLYEGLLKC